MKTLLSWLSLLALTLCFGLSASAQNTDNMPVITVTGTAEVMVAPDEVVFSLDVTKTDKDLQVAKRLNDETVGKVLELTRRFSIAPQNVKTDYISVEMKYESIRDSQKKVYDEDGDEVGTKVFRGYEVSKTVIVRLTDITRFEEFFAEVLKTGITEVNRVTFETSKLRENMDTARDLAMKAAREKATAMAASVGQTIGKAVKITEGNTANQAYTAGFANNSVGTSGSFSQSVATFAPGAIKVEAQVTASFLLN
ncbi:MAG: SIMPL domain-containing protein [Acidobacteria bacterium]|nr:SIMPL domain-containing protein [Acidobacteriota bacterium]